MIHILVPLSTKRSFLLFALSRIETIREAGTRFRHGEARRHDRRAQREGRYFCFCSAVPQRLIWLTPEIGMGAVGQPRPRRKPGLFLHGDDMGDIAHARAADRDRR